MSHIPWGSLFWLGRKLGNARQERRGKIHTSSVRFDNAGRAGPQDVPPREVEDLQNPVFCSCFGLQSTIKTLGYIQLILIVFGTLIAGVATALLTTGDHPQAWYFIAVTCGFVVQLWLAGLFSAAALLHVKGVKERKRGYLRVWLLLNISGLLTSIIVHLVAALQILQGDYFTNHAHYGMLFQALVFHVSWGAFALLVRKMEKLQRDGEEGNASSESMCGQGVHRTKVPIQGVCNVMGSV